MNTRSQGMQQRLVSHSAFIFSIRAFPAVALLVVGIAFSHALPPALNGVYQQVWVYLAILLAIVSLGIPPLMLTHQPKTIDSWLLSLRGRHIALYLLWILAFTGFYIGLFYRTVLFYPLLLGLLFFAQVWMLLLETYLIIHQRFISPALINVIYSALFCAIHFAFLWGFLEIRSMFIALVLLVNFRTLSLFVLSRSVFENAKSQIKRRGLPLTIKKQWIQLGIYDISQVAFRWIDKLIIARLVGPALFAIYFIGTTDVPFMAMLLSAAGNGLLQQMASGDGTHASRIKMVNFSGALLARVVFPVFFFLFFFRAEFIEVVFSKTYLDSIPLFAISILSLPLRAYNYTSILQNLNRVNIINLGAVLDLSIAIALAFPLYYWKGLPGVAFAFMISTYLQALFYLWQTAKALDCSILQLIPWRKWALMLVFFGSVAFGIHNLLSRYFKIQGTLLIGFAATVLMIVLALVPVVLRKNKNA